MWAGGDRPYAPSPNASVNGRRRTRSTSRRTSPLLPTTSIPVTSSAFTSRREIFTPPPGSSIADVRARSRSVAYA